MTLSSLLAHLVLFCQRRAWIVLIAGLALAGLSVLAAGSRLKMSTDTDLLFADTLPWRLASTAFNRDFPQFHDLIVAVVDANLPEQADATAKALAERLSEDHAHFTEVRRPDASPYLAREGLLFLDPPQLESLLNSTIDAQPFLGQLVSDPSARGLFSALSLIGLGVEQGQANLGPYMPALKAFHDAMAGALAGNPEPMSWTRLLGGQLADLGPKYRFVLARPNLDYGTLEPGGAATQAVRDVAAGLEFVKSGQAHVRLTGQIPLADEEFATVAQGAVTGLAISFVLIALWLFLAVGSWRLIVPILFTLILGLLSTLLFAALFVGTLNLVSVGFGILFVGIAVDFAIQFSVRFREARLETPDIATALAATARRAGGQILVAACATAAGFLAFVPTDFRGVAELGLIAGFGMLIAFFCTLTFLPAAITLLSPEPEAAEVGFGWARPLDGVVRRHRLPILAVFSALALFGAVLLPRLIFDADPLHTKNPHTEAVRTLYDLIDNPLTNPFTVDILAPSAAAAETLAGRLKALPLVGSVLSINSFVPTQQTEKLALVADASSILGATLAPRGPAAPITPNQIRAAAKSAAAQMSKAAQKLPPDHPVAAIAGDLHAIESAPDGPVLAVQSALTRFLPAQLDQLRTALSAQPVTLASVPPDIARDWLLPDGRARVQAVPKASARDTAGLREFVAQVLTVAPNAGGSAVTIEATSQTIVGAFRTAALGALAAITVILMIALRRPLDTALVLAPLLLTALMTVIVAVLAPLPLNYANIIALPLLLGVGVSFNIYFVMNWRAGRNDPLGSATARAVIFSALTTATAFGSLALSGHPGTASMGDLLLISLGCTLVATLAFVPALLAAIGPARGVRVNDHIPGVVPQAETVPAPAWRAESDARPE